MIGADRAGPVAQLGLEVHQPAVADLLQRQQLDPAPGRRHRAVQVPGAGQGLAEQVAQVRALPLQLGPGLEQPVVVPAGQQLAAVHRDGPAGAGRRRLGLAGLRRGQGRRALGPEVHTSARQAAVSRQHRSLAVTTSGD